MNDSKSMVSVKCTLVYMRALKYAAVYSSYLVTEIAIIYDFFLKLIQLSNKLKYFVTTKF